MINDDVSENAIDTSQNQSRKKKVSLSLKKVGSSHLNNSINYYSGNTHSRIVTDAEC